MTDIKLKIDLQLFTEEKTEKASPKKKQDSRKKGQVMQSREINTAAALMASVLALKYSGGFMFRTITEATYFFRDLFYTDILNESIGGYKVLLYIIMYVTKAVVIVIGVGFVAAFITNKLQVGNLFTTETLKIKPERLNPIEGFKRMFSMRTFVELVKSLLKIGIVGFVGYSYLAKNIGLVLKSQQLVPIQFSYMIFELSINLAIRMTFAITVIAILDFFYQRYDYDKNLKMSKQEVKEEYKQSEGDPQIKSKIKEKQRQAAMRRMMQEIPKADVIITNPTHFAVAVKYDEDKFEAPYVVAKGKNLIAQNIKQKARETSIPIVENKPLAQALYKEVEIGQMISPQLYEAVAEILAYVYSLKEKI